LEDLVHADDVDGKLGGSEEFVVDIVEDAKLGLAVPSGFVAEVPCGDLVQVVARGDWVGGLVGGDAEGRGIDVRGGEGGDLLGEGRGGAQGESEEEALHVRKVAEAVVIVHRVVGRV
jgi:hypothetical protein